MGKTGQFKETLKPGQRASFPINDLTEEDMQQTRAIVEGFLRMRNHEDPVAHSNRLMYCAVNGVKMDEKGVKSEWLNAPGRPNDTPQSILMKRLTILSGRGFKQYVMGTPSADNKPSPNRKKNKPGVKPSKSTISIDEHDLKEIREKKALYIKEFGFNTQADLDLLDELVRNKVLVRKFQDAAIVGGATDSKSADSIKKLTDTLVSLQKALGITADQRSKVKSQSKEGTVAELFRKYEDTKREWPNLEQNFLIEELRMLVQKHNRRREDGSREISAAEFKRLSRGISLNEAYKLLGKKNPDIFGSEVS